MLTPILKKLVEERIQKLDANNNYRMRQIQSLTQRLEALTQRLEDYNTQFKADVRECIELKSFLSTLAAVTEPQAEETRRGLSERLGE
jgi:regulator of sigma D